jgi:hypothetical protein
MSNELNLKAEAYYEARRDYEAKKAASNIADTERRRREAELVDYMIEHQIKSFDRNDGTKPLLAASVSISVTKDNYDQIRAWLLETEGDDKDYVETVVSKPAVLELVKKKLKAGDDVSDFPDFLKPDTRPTLRVNGWKSVAGDDNPF